MRSLAALFVVALSTPALAQAPGETPIQPRSSPEAPAEQKSPDTAVMISVGFTLGGLFTTMAGAKSESPVALLGVAAMFVGPSTGRWYAGSDGLGSLALRGIGGLGMMAGFTLLITSDECEGTDCPSHHTEYGAMILGGLGLWAGTTIYDLVMANRDANSWNRSHSHDPYALRLKPTMISVAGHHAMGLALGGHF